MTKLTVFLAHGGKAIWSTDESTVTEKQLQQDYLEPNGFVWKRIKQVSNCFYVEIDHEKTPLQDFYSWEEALTLNTKPECWRSYYFFKDSTNADWFNGKQLSESEIEGKPIQEYYEDILRLFTE